MAIKLKELSRREFIIGSTLATASMTTFGRSTGLSNRVLRESKNSDYRLNEQIRQAQESALKILKPSKKELEHGLELHANSLVIETYGFMPRAALDGDIIATAIEDNASALEINDLQENMTMTQFVKNPEEREEFMNAWNASGVTCIFQNAGEEGNAIDRLIKRLAHFTYATDMMRDFVQRAVIPEDITLAKEENRHCLYFSGNGVPLPQDWVSLEEELRYIEIFFQLGIRMMHLTYNRRNMIGDGCAEKANGGLSDFGRAVVKELNRVGIIVDVAHSSWQTSLEAAQVSEKPMVASHSTAGAIYPHIRSKPDHVIKAIADSGGYIGICCIPRFLRGSGDIAAFMNHIDYVVKKFGPEHVGIGTDVSYRSNYSGEEWAKIPSTRRTRNRWEALWPEDEFETTPEMRQSLAWTNWPLFTVGMVQLGYSDADIQKIIGGNAMRVAKAVQT